MGLNKSIGNMYGFITHTWNTIKGECPHGCLYCYMNRYKNQKPLHFDEKELRTDLSSLNYIFVGSSCDMWADEIPDNWIWRTLKHCSEYHDNQYFFQTKNPKNIKYRILPRNSTVCVTLETNRHYKEVMQQAPRPDERVMHILNIHYPLHITIEPIMDFDMVPFLRALYSCHPVQVNIGADSMRWDLSEPSKEKTLELIGKLREFTTVHLKHNLKRIIGGDK